MRFSIFEFQIAIQKKRSTVLSSLCRSRSLRPTLTICYIRCISQYAKLLQEVKFGEAVFIPHLYENIYFIFTCLDELIQAEVKISAEERILSINNIIDIKEQLEDCLLQITDAFVLFSHYVWRIINLLDIIVFDG